VRVAKSKEKMAVKTAQLVTSRFMAAPVETAAPSAVTDGVPEEDEVGDETEEVCMPLGVALTLGALALPEEVGTATEAEPLDEGAPGREPVAEALAPPPMEGGAEAWEGSTS